MSLLSSMFPVCEAWAPHWGLFLETSKHKLGLAYIYPTRMDPKLGSM